MDAAKPLCIPDAARWNEYIAVPLAFGANLFLAFLVIVKSPKSLKIYNRVLLTNCVCDLMLSAACLIIGYVSVVAVCRSRLLQATRAVFRSVPLVSARP